MYIVFNLKKVNKTAIERNASLLELNIEDFINTSQKFGNRDVLTRILSLQKHKSKLNQFFAIQSSKTIRIENYIIHRIKDSDIEK